MNSPIPIGTLVTWTSQANAGRKTKTGTVLCYCPRLKDPRDMLYIARGVVRLSNERTDGLSWSDIDRYLVAVPRGGKSILVDIYTPRASAIRVVPQAGV